MTLLTLYKKPCLSRGYTPYPVVEICSIQKLNYGVTGFKPCVFDKPTIFAKPTVLIS